MKKPILLAALTVSLFALSAAEAQTADGTTAKKRRTTTATVSARDNAALANRLRRIEASTRQITTTAPQGSRIDGSVSRAARSGNPLQMINPFAPKEYGDGTDVTRRESDDPYQRAQGLRLVAVEF